MKQTQYFHFIYFFVKINIKYNIHCDSYADEKKVVSIWQSDSDPKKANKKRALYVKAHQHYPVLPFPEAISNDKFLTALLLK